MLSNERDALHFAISVSVPTSPCRARSSRASLRIRFSSRRLVVSNAIRARSALITRPDIATVIGEGVKDLIF
jgi:hypothetical protein